MVLRHDPPKEPPRVRLLQPQPGDLGVAVAILAFPSECDPRGQAETRHLSDRSHRHTIESIGREHAQPVCGEFQLRRQLGYETSHCTAVAIDMSRTVQAGAPRHPRRWCHSPQSGVTPILIVKPLVVVELPFQVALVPKADPIEIFAPDGSNQSLDERIRTRVPGMVLISSISSTRRLARQ
jgi:hypothetical protein